MQIIESDLGDSRLFQAYEGDRLVGMTVLKIRESELISILVDSAYRRQGSNGLNQGSGEVGAGTGRTTDWVHGLYR